MKKPVKNQVKKKIMDLVMPILPKNELSHFVGRLVHQPLPQPLARKSVEWFARYYQIDLQEAELPLEQYRTIGELFTRKLKPGVRPLGPGIVHPSDSRISECGVIEKFKCIQAKGRDYSIRELLRSNHWALAFEGGTYFTYYLCPTDYHRVHAPVDAKIKWMCQVPGEMWPVNDWSVNAISDLFSVNERLIIGMETLHGRCALVMVAATNVGNMTVSFDDKVRTNVRAAERAAKEKAYDPPREIRKGDEIGVFHMGSTVVMLYEKGMVPPSACEQLKGVHVRVGESLLSH